MSLKLTFYGHATLGLEIDGQTVLVDPFFTGNPAASSPADAFDKVDYILLTHGHGDHVGDTVAIAKRTGARVVANFEIINWLQAQGVENVHAQHIGGAHDHAFGNLKLTIAFHGSSMPDGTYGGNPAGLRIRTRDGKTVYIAGDTALFGDMRLIGAEGIDLAVLPIGDNFTMGPEDALQAVKLVEPKLVVPVHYDTWGLIAQNAAAWADRVRAETRAQVRALAPGESLEL